MLIPEAAVGIASSLIMALACLLGVAVVVNNRLRCRLAAGRSIEDSLRVDLDHAKEELDNSAAILRISERQVRGLTEECGQALSEVGRLKDDITELVADAVKRSAKCLTMSDGYAKATKELAEDRKERLAAMVSLDEVRGKSDRYGQNVIDLKTNNCDLTGQKDRAVADTKRVTEELAMANFLLVAIGKESTKLKVERDEARGERDMARIEGYQAAQAATKIIEEQGKG